MSSTTPPEDERDAWDRALVEVGSLLEPDRIAVVGASNTEGKPGNVLFRNILGNDFEGDVYPINPSGDEVLGVRAYPSVADVPTDLDTVIFAVPGSVIPDIIPACAEKNVTSIVIVSAGFAEAVSADRQRLQEEIVELCNEYDIRAIGPNTTGMVSMKRDLVASFMPFPSWNDGSIALAAQTGIFAGVYMEEIMARDVQTLGYNYSLGLGNKMDLDETDFVRYAGQDETIDVIQLYLEEIRDPEAFYSSAGRVGAQTPIVLLKSGRTAAGRRAARWHTASRPAADGVVENACRANGIVRADTVPEFMNYAKGFAYQPAPTGRRVGVLSLSGANAVMVSDYVSDSLLELAELAPETLQSVKDLVPEWQPVRNPVDQWLALPSGSRTAHDIPLGAVLADDGVDAVITIHLASEEPDFDGIEEVYENAMAQNPEKPILSYIMGAETKDRWLTALEGTDVPVFDSAHQAVDTLEHMYWWRRYADGEAHYEPSVTESTEVV